MSSPQAPSLVTATARSWQGGLACRLMMLMAVLLAGQAHAGDPLSGETAPVHLVFEDYPPYEYVEGGQPVGVHVSILREAAARLGVPLRLESMPWLRAIHVAEQGDVDGIFSLFKTPDRSRFLVFPDHPLSMETNVLLTSRARPVQVLSRDDLRGKSVGVVAGNAYGEWFDAADWIDRQPVTGSERLLLKQAYGRTDVSVSNARVARFLIERLRLQERILMLDFVVAEAPLWVGFSRAKGGRSERLAAQFSAALKAMQEEGQIDAILRQHDLESAAAGAGQ